MANSPNVKRSLMARVSKTVYSKAFGKVLIVLLAISSFVITQSITADPRARLTAGAAVIQEGCPPEPEDCTRFIACPENDVFGSGAATGDFQVITAPGRACRWFVATASPFVEITSEEPEAGGSAVVTYELQANTTSTIRSATIEVSVRGPGGTSNVVATHRITQNPGVTCTYTLSESSKNFTAQGGDGSFDVDAPGTCPWQAVSNSPSIVTIISGGSNTQGRTVGYRVSENLTTSQRTGTITVQDKTYTIIQSEATCTFSVSPTSGEFPEQGGPGSFTVITSIGCTWEAVNNNPSFITIISGGSNDRAGVVNYTVALNPNQSPRTGTIQVQGQVHTITQVGADSGTPRDPCTYTLLESSNDFTAPGGDGSFVVRTANDCPWEATSDSTWLKTTSSGRGEGTARYTVEANPETSSRMGKITVRGQTYTVTQAGIGQPRPDCEFTLSPKTISIGESRTELINGRNEAGSSFGFMVTPATDAGCPWKAISNNPDWITIDKGGEDKIGKGFVIFSVEEYTGAENRCEGSNSPQIGKRCGSITVGSETFAITQFAAGRCVDLNVSPLLRPFAIGETAYGTLNGEDCRSAGPNGRGNSFRADRYVFVVEQDQGQNVAINVGSTDFDPFITLLELRDGQEIKVGDNKDDDGAGFRNARLPSLPPKQGELRNLKKGTYIIEVTAFTDSINRRTVTGNYALYIASEGASITFNPVILGAVTDGKTLVVIGENFDKNAKLFIDDTANEEKNTKNAQSRNRTALIALKSGNKVKEKAPIILRVNNRSRKESEVFVYPFRP